MHVATPDNLKEKVLTTFFILDGPNNLLSRFVVQKLLPATYSTFVRDTNCKKLGQIKYTDATSTTVRSVEVQRNSKSDNVCKADKEKSDQVKVKPTKIVQKISKSDNICKADKEKSGQNKSDKVKVKPTGSIETRNNQGTNQVASSQQRGGAATAASSSHQWSGAAEKVVQPIASAKEAQATTAKGKTGGRKSQNDQQGSHGVSKAQDCQNDNTTQGKVSEPQWP